MTTANQTPRFSGKSINRENFLLITRAAIETQSYRFARQAALNWLAIYPGDLGFNLELAKALLCEDKLHQGVPMLEKIVRLDPEYADAWECLALTTAGKMAENAAANAWVFGTEIFKGRTMPEWSSVLHQVYSMMKNRQVDEAERYIRQAIGLNPDSVLTAVLHMRLTAITQDATTVYRLADLYHSRWPDCLQFALYLADGQLHVGKETESVSLLHHCVANDSSGQVPERLWGKSHAYKSLWPESLDIDFDLAIPAAVAGYLGWNKLPGTEMPTAAEIVEQAQNQAFNYQSEANTPVEEAVEAQPAAPQPVVENNVSLDDLGLGLETATENQVADAVEEEAVEEIEKLSRIRDGLTRIGKIKRPLREVNEDLAPIESEFERLAARMKRSKVVEADGRFPMYVLFTTHSGLIRQYGEQSAQVVENEMQALAVLIGKRNGWGAMTYIPDDPTNAKSVELNSIDSTDPWSLKLSLVDLDQKLAAKGAMIGAVLIVGGPEVVPFHHLPNPTDDSDETIYSDNPYATLDSNYFVPEWPVGRLPGENGPDAGLLLEQLRKMRANHTQTARPSSWWRRFFFFLDFFNKRNRNIRSKNARKGAATFGYSAAVWQRSSIAVYKNIGESKTMLISPPDISGSFEAKKINEARLAYYNLHGLAETGEWYGQRELDDNDNGPDYPVALSTTDLKKNGSAPSVVFSEACYGGYINSKSEKDSIALRFLSIGTEAVIASTCIAYGSVNTPLIGADLLGFHFWKYLRQGITAGEAYMNAKVEMAREMINRQGFLDGEDQKTLLSFAFYGDPLVRNEDIQKQVKSVPRTHGHPVYKTISDAEDGVPAHSGLSREVLNQVKSVVEDYLPGLDEAEIQVCPQLENDGEEMLQGSLAGSKDVGANTTNGRVVVTFRKNIRIREHTHEHYARATLDKKGKMVKLAISR